ncbi:MAG TPA: MMPL family transporter [Phycisphaerae bacterium]|nr:MMPL family transporter [Phycisphaerae bacterium]
MRSYFRFVTSHPIPVLVLVVLPAAVLGAFMLVLTRDTSPDAFIPPEHPALLSKRAVFEEFGLTEPIVVCVIRDAEGGVFNRDTLELIRELTEAIRNLPGVEPDDVLSLATESGVYFREGEPGFERLMAEVPTDRAGLEALREDVLGYELYRGTLVAADGSATCILLRLRDDERADHLYRTLERLVGEIPHGDERIVVAGEPAVRAHMGTAVSDDALRMNFVCPVVMALLIVLAYRTVRGCILPLCVIGGASALALGSMAAWGVPVYIVTNGIFVIIMALGVADSLHLMGQYYEEQLDLRGRSRQEVVVDACTALWFPLLVTSLTDVAGFFALYLVGVMPPIRYFGLFTCVGVLGALLFSYTVIPAGLAVLPLRTSGAIRKRSASADEAVQVDSVGLIMGRLGGLIWRRRGIVLAVGGVVIAVSAWGASRLIINDARILAFKDNHPLVRATRAINERFDGTAELDIVVRASEPGAMLRPEVLTRIEQLENFTESLPHVGGTHSAAGWVKRAHQKMHEEDPAYYAIPDDADDTRFYLDVLSAPTSPMARSLGEVIDETYTRANLIVRMTSSEFIHQRDVVQALQGHLAEEFNDEILQVEVSGRVYLDYEWLGLIRSTHFRSVAFSFACVLLMTGLMFRSVLAGVLCTLTVGLAVLVNYALMGFGQIPLGVGTSMFASIAIGAGVNFPIHVLDRLRVGLGVPDAEPAAVFRTTLTFTGRALLFTSAVVAVGFLLLCVSEFRTLVRFGLLVGAGMCVSFVASVTFLPAAVAVIRPRFLWSSRAAARRS